MARSVRVATIQCANAYYLLHHGYRPPHVHIPWGDYAQGIVNWPKSLFSKTCEWGQEFDEYFYRYYYPHQQFRSEVQEIIDSWYIQNITETIIYFQAAQGPARYLVFTGEGARYTASWAFGTAGNELNLMGWYFVDVFHAGYSTVLNNE